MATIDSLTLKATPLTTDTIELNDGQKATLLSLPLTTAGAADTTSKVSTHAALTDAHGATASNTASRIVSRNADGTTAVSGLQLDTSATPTQAEGLLSWDNGEKALRVAVSATESLTVGEEMTPRYRNSTGSTLLQGEVVFVNGAVGSNATVDRAKADALSTSRGTIGIVTDDAGIANSQRGRICTIGRSNNLNTSSWSEGTELWLSPSVAGGMTSTQPTAEGQFRVYIGTVERQHATQGVINVGPRFYGSVTGESVLVSTSKAAARTAIGAVIGTDVQAWNTNLDTFATYTPATLPVSTAAQAALDAKAPIVSPGFTSATTGNVVTVKNTNSAGYSGVSILDLNDVERMVLGYGNTLGSAPYAGAPYIATALPLRLVNTSGGKYVDILTSSGNGELLFANTAPGANVIAMQNKTDTEGSISGIVARNAAGIEFGAFGGGGKEGSAYPFSGSVFIESSDIFAGGTNTVAPDIKIIQTYLNGSGGIVYNERMRFADQGAWTVFKSGVWPTQNRFIFTDTVGSGNIYIQPENGRIRLGYNEAVAGILDPNFGALQFIQPTNTATAFSVTQDLIATGHQGFASGSNAYVIGTDGASIDFRSNPTGTLAGGTLRMQLNLSTGNLTVGGVNGNTITAGTGTLNLNSTSSSLTSFTGSGTSSGTNTGDQASVSGNAGTATALQTARTINGVSFDGTANIVIPSQKLTGYTVGTLPAGTIGDEAYVTDATAPTYLGALTGGGAVVCPVFYNGSAWVSH